MGAQNVIATLRDLVAINSVNPAYDGQCSEREIQEYIELFFMARGISVWRQDVMPDRFNVVASLPGRNPSRRIVFEAHSDTAGVGGMSIPPFTPCVRDGRMYGRGACDTKAGLAAMMHALADLKSVGYQPPCEIWFAASVDEEHSCQGVLKLCEKLHAAAAVVSEPTNLQMVVASKGCIRWRMTVRGKAAHSSKPELGVNAIVEMAHLLTRLSSDAAVAGASEHHLVGRPTINVGTIEGGTQVNIVPDTCSVTIDRRLIPGEDPNVVLGACRAFVDKLRNGRELDVQIELLIEDSPLETPPDSPIVRYATEVLADAGLDSRPGGVPFGSDASKFAKASIPAIILGPGSIDQAHTADEYVEIDQVERAFLVYRRLMCVFD